MERAFAFVLIQGSFLFGGCQRDDPTKYNVMGIRDERGVKITIGSGVDLISEARPDNT
jgi:hypothetical protein